MTALAKRQYWRNWTKFSVFLIEVKMSVICHTPVRAVRK